ncbi:cell division protein FtsX [Pedobacter sp. KBW06]|uniref:ABC transporter permease n=1 Tax=Pedobacter sp. KBW06 TaxID=2153359 RepID=UPI000F5A20E8|nr:ABC transporter permease [Pedobacter sp. KBW06]RQO75041.1 cell division protein FtsX [Pedobacter sp. KBW06]
MFRLNLKIALRNLWKNKGYTLINVGGLAIGLASCMILLLYVAYEWSFDKQTSGYERTYVVYNNQKNGDHTVNFPWTPGVLADELRTKIPGITRASKSTYPAEHLISYNHQNFKKKAVFTDTAFLKIFDYKVLQGNRDQMLKNPNAVVLTQRMAKILFGNENPINKTVKIDGKEDLIVEGVIEDVPVTSSIQFDYLGSWAMFLKQNVWAQENEKNWGNNYCLTVLQIQDNSFFERVTAEIKGVYQRNQKENRNFASIHPISKWHLYNKFENGKSVGGKIDSLRIFLLLAFCILLIACINFMNLSTARSEKRAKEVGVRKAIGAARKSLIAQFMMESVLLAFFGMVVAFMLMEISLPYFNSILNTNLTINYKDWEFWSVLITLTLFTGLVAGSYPAFYLSSFNPVRVLKGFNLPGNSSLSIRKVLVVFQFVFAVCLIICTVVIYQQLNYVKNKPVGYNRAGLVEIPVEGRLLIGGKMKLLREQLLKSGAVTNASMFSTSLSRGGNNTSGVSWPGKNPKVDVLVNFRFAHYDFAATLGTKMVMGREFSPQYADSGKVIINETAVKVMSLSNPVGKVITWGGEKLTVIGVVKDFVMETPYQTVTPMIMMVNSTGDGEGVLVMRLNPTQSISASMQQITTLVKEMNPDFPVDATFLSDSFEAKFQNEKVLGILANWFGGFSIFISCLGLLGLSLFMAEQRRKEISIRKVLGASMMNILTLLNKDFVKLVAIANLIAFPLAYIMISQWLSAFEFRISISFIPFAIAIGLSLLIAFLTVSAQSVKVAKSNPIDALKYE